MSDPSLLCRVDDIPDHGARAARIDSPTGGFDIVLLREGDQVFAYHNECPHAGRALDYVPGKFLLKDGRIICAAHGATFSVSGGQCLGGPCSNGLARVPIEVIDGEVWPARMQP